MKFSQNFIARLRCCSTKFNNLPVNCESSYQRKLRERGIRKNRLGKENWKVIDYKIKKKKQQSGRSPQVYIDGKLCPPQKVRKEISRQAFCSTIDKLSVQIDTPSPMTPDGIQVCSPVSSTSPNLWPLGSPWLEFLDILPSDIFKRKLNNFTY
ncbi:LOW QUALITY PROTEIN: hypothetical protein N5P37_009534 [Trichoderma harzianum]|nr:LOW QUALITY PROTEIN: hypothetical protein N5P37_009534 [Trichoderma harzianum]